MPKRQSNIEDFFTRKISKKTKSGDLADKSIVKRAVTADLPRTLVDSAGSTLLYVKEFLEAKRSVKVSALCVLTQKPKKRKKLLVQNLSLICKYFLLLQRHDGRDDEEFK